MNCSDFKKEMNNFISDTIEVDTAKEFIEHFKECPACNEELEIYYMINKTFNDTHTKSESTGMSNSYDFKKQLSLKIAYYQEVFYHKYKINFLIKFLLSGAELVAVLMVAYFIIFVLGGNNGF